MSISYGGDYITDTDGGKSKLTQEQLDAVTGA